jgi:hypothetical protein
MPLLSSFRGIKISINSKDHAPPHFHAEYGEYLALYTISTQELFKGIMPPREDRVIQEWAKQHQRELMKNWDIANPQKLYNGEKQSINIFGCKTMMKIEPWKR